MEVTTYAEQVDYPVKKSNHPRCFLDFQINTSEDLGDMYLRPEQLTFSETVSNMFEGQLRLKVNDGDKTSENAKPLAFDKLLGKSATVKVGLPNPAYPDPDPMTWRLTDWRFRCFNGIISRFTMAEPGVYNVDLKPDLFRLTLTNRYHLYGDGTENSPIPLMTAVAQVLTNHNITFSDQTDNTYNEVLKRTQNWLQAGETDFEFIHRLLDKASVYYYFTHDETSHQLILSNQASYSPLFSDDKKIRYTFTSEDSLDQDDCVKVYSYNQSLATSRVKTTVVRSQAAWEEDQEAVYSAYNGANTKTDEVQDELVFHHYKIFQFSGSDTEAQFDADKTYAKITTAATGLSGKCSSPEFTPVTTFSMTNSTDTAVRPELEKSPFVITSVHHQVNDSGHYENSFEATESDGFIAKFNIQSTHQGSILAQVVHPPASVSKKGTWKYLEKQDFVWSKQTVVNQELQNDTSYNETGVWVEFSTGDPAPPVWVKLAQHMQTVPEVGVTVTVSRSNDDSEAPEVSSIIQNNGNKVIMPGDWTANTTVGNSYSTNYGDGKRVSFGQNSQADLPNAISIVENQYSTGEYKDSSYSQGGSYSYSTSEQAKNGLLSRSDSFGNTYSTHHGAISESYSEIDKSTSESKIGESINTSTVGTSTNTSKTSTETSHVKTGTRTTNATTGKETSTSDVGTSKTTSTVGTSTSSSEVGISTSDSMVGVSTSTSLAGVNTGINTVGVSSNISAVGASKNMSATGMSDNMSAVGKSSDLSVVGMHSSISSVGMSTGVSSVGMSTNMNSVGVSNSTSLTGVHSDTSTVGSSSSTSTVGATSSMSTVGTSSSINTVGASSNISATGASSNISAVGAHSNISANGATSNIAVNGAGLNIDLSGAVFSLKLCLLEVNLLSTLKMVM